MIAPQNNPAVAFAYQAPSDVPEYNIRTHGDLRFSHPDLVTLARRAAASIKNVVFATREDVEKMTYLDKFHVRPFTDVERAIFEKALRSEKLIYFL